MNLSPQLLFQPYKCAIGIGLGGVEVEGACAKQRRLMEYRGVQRRTNPVLPSLDRSFKSFGGQLRHAYVENR